MSNKKNKIESETIQRTIPPKTERNKNQELSKRKIEQLLLFSIVKARNINQGNNGVIKKINSDDIPAEFFTLLKKLNGVDLENGKDFAFKILKIYTHGKGKQEYESQKKAYELIMQKMEESGNEIYARVPKIYYFEEFPVRKDLEIILNADGIDVSHGKVEIMMMDMIEGEDFATFLYKKVLQNHPKTSHYSEKDISEMTIESLAEEVSSALDFRIPGGKNNEKGANAYEEEIVFNQNTEKIISFLKKRGIIIDQSILDKVSKTINLFHANGLYHRDLHERNIMFDKNGEVYIIDFGESLMDAQKLNAEEVYTNPLNGKVYGSDEAIINRYQTLTESIEDDYNSDLRSLLEKLKEIGEDDDFKIAYEEIKQKITLENVDSLSSDISSKIFGYANDNFYNAKFLIIKNFIISLGRKEREEFILKLLNTKDYPIFFKNKIRLLDKI